MRFSKMILFACFAMASVHVQAANTPKAKPTAIYEMNVTGDIEIDASGHVRSQQLKGEFPPAVAQLIENNVRSWRFEPIQIDGRPVIAKTRLSLQLEATQIAGDSYRLKVLDLIFGTPENSYALTPPRYPEQAQRANLGAKVIMLVRFDASGNVVDAHALQTSLSAPGRESIARQWRQQFEQASLAVARRWKFKPAETINGAHVGSTIRVPIVFSMKPSRGKPENNGWKTFFPGPVNPSNWAGVSAQAEASDLAQLKDGEAQPLASRFKPTEAIVGTVF